MLAGLVLWWVVTFSVLVVRRHHGFWDVDFDMGIQDQTLWLLAHGRGFLTVRGLQVFGHHASPADLLLVPAYWLGAGPDFLNVFQVLALALGVIPLFLLARERNVASWGAGVLAGAFLLHPAVQFFSWDLFHPEVVAITPLLCAYLCAVRRSWRWFALWSVLAVAWKEDVALAVVVLGILVWLRGDRRVGLLTSGIALAWFLAMTAVVMPAINGGSLQSAELYSGVGGSVGGILKTAATDPGRLTARVFSASSREFAWRLVVPFGGLPVLALGPLAIGVPQFLLDAVSDLSFTRTITMHYAALPVAALAIAMVEGVALLGRRLGAMAVNPALVLVLSGALYGTLAWGPSPAGAEYHNGWWPPAVNPRLGTQRAAVAAVPAGAPVSAAYTLVPQLSERAEIYSFPNPWLRRDWGVRSSATRSPRRVEWIVVDRAVLTSRELSVLDGILRGGEFRVVLDRDAVVVARRVR